MILEAIFEVQIVGTVMIRITRIGRKKKKRGGRGKDWAFYTNGSAVVEVGLAFCYAG